MLVEKEKAIFKKQFCGLKQAGNRIQGW